MAQPTPPICNRLTPPWRPLPKRSDPYRTTLVNKKSLTLRAQQLCQERSEAFSLTVLEQVWQMATYHEQQLLSIPKHEKVLVRKVCFGSHQATMISARSVIPSNTWYHNRHLFKKLGKQSLGQLLFKHPSSHRIGMWFQSTNDQPATRLSLFTLNGKTLLVEETFLSMI